MVAEFDAQGHSLAGGRGARRQGHAPSLSKFATCRGRYFRLWGAAPIFGQSFTVARTFGWRPLDPLIGNQTITRSSVLQVHQEPVTAPMANAVRDGSIRESRDTTPLVVGLWILGGLLGAIRLGLMCRIPLAAMSSRAVAVNDHFFALSGSKARASVFAACRRSALLSEPCQ